MSKVDDLLQGFADNKVLANAKKLKSLIESDPLILGRFQQILSLQKQLVNLEFATGVKQIEAKIHYQNELDQLLETPLVSEYLNDLDELNDLAQMISGILNDTLNKTDTLR